MYITEVELRGFRDLPHYTLTGLGRAVHLNGPSPATTALGDGIELVFAAFSTVRLDALMHRWGLLGPDDPAEIDGEPFPTEAGWTDPVASRALLAEGEQALRAEVELKLDPPLFGRLRDVAARDPRVATALARKPTVRIAVGALFTSGHDAMAISLQRFAIGDEVFQITGSDRPKWVDRFLRLVTTRFHRLDLSDDSAEGLMDAAMSRDRFHLYEAWRSSLGEVGPKLRVARGPGDQPVILGDELPIRRFGQVGQDRAALAAAVHLSGADVLWAETSDPLLKDTVDGDGSALEQVWIVNPVGEVQVVPNAPEPPLPAPTRMRRFRTPEVVS